MATSSREARRRKIIERGSDRLALITGRIQTLPSSSSPQSHHSHTVSAPPLFSQDRDLHTHLSDQNNVTSCGKDDASGTAFLKHDTSNESESTNAIDGVGRVEPQLRKCETSIEAARIPALEVGSRIQPSLVLSSVQNSSISMVETEPHPSSRTHHPRFFTANRISSAIIASESTRILCSVSIALLVVLSYIGFPLLGSNVIKSIIAFRPLYLVLLTDITIVFTRLLFAEQRGSWKAEEEATEVPSDSGYGSAEVVGKALENGLVLYKAINAVFMDCSVYAVVVICGPSLVQHWLLCV